MDKPSENRIKNLHPLVRKEVTQIVKECDEALTGRAKVRITQGLRTFKEQDELYAQGRTKAGKKVTNAKAGQSIHNYGLAVDICLIIDGKTASWDTAKDWDNDGVADINDDYPIDATKASANAFPASGFGTLLYEDQWPYKGDFDFNDLVVDYRFNTITNAANNVAEIVYSFGPKASGAM